MNRPDPHHACRRAGAVFDYAVGQHVDTLSKLDAAREFLADLVVSDQTGPNSDQAIGQCQATVLALQAEVERRTEEGYAAYRQLVAARLRVRLEHTG